MINKEGNITHSFNSDELFKFLEDKKKKDVSLEEFTINDIDADFSCKIHIRKLEKFLFTLKTLYIYKILI